MSGSTNKAEPELLQTGALVEFRILVARTELCPDGENVSVHVDIIRPPLCLGGALVS